MHQFVHHHLYVVIEIYLLANLGILSEIIQVEDHGLSSSFFPFIVVEDDVCTEICTLESKIELVVTDSFLRGTEKLEAHNQAMDFIHEMGWLLLINSLRFRLGYLDPNSDRFPFKQFKYLVKFCVDHDSCVVVNKLLDILFSGVVGAGEQHFPSPSEQTYQRNRSKKASKNNYRLLLLLCHVSSRAAYLFFAIQRL
ncbi:unnamed protein product [Fraxinus pennsylvanica]|uniref:Uncharacterized protein n=1 Tax=Fraxinus pennsylvanica TaxID=56036 RepID=A0AAD1Z563_9LAMI|nr:unnamed protein product [Fraxinus pennsylvanica]